MSSTFCGSVFAGLTAFFLGALGCSESQSQKDAGPAEARSKDATMLAVDEPSARSEEVQHRRHENDQMALSVPSIERPDKRRSTMAQIGSIANPTSTAKESRALPETAKVLVSDSLIVLGYTPEAVISPDQQTIAFVSSGSVFTCDVNGGPPKALAPVPDTMSAVLSEPQYAEVRANEGALSRVIRSKEFRANVRPRIRAFHGFRWSRTGDTILFGIDAARAASSDHTGWEIHRLSMQGTDSIVATIPPDESGIARWDLVGDGDQILIERMRGNAFYYDIMRKKFHELPFVKLTPTNDGLSFVGIDSHANQLVLVDRHFKIVKKFNIHAPRKQFGSALLWSPNQEFVLLRSQIGFDHYSNWIGFRTNLATGQERELSGLFFREHIQFTGRGGELVQCGLTGRKSSHFSGDEILGAQLLLIPEGSAPTQVLWRVAAAGPIDVTVSLGRLHNMPPFVASSNGELFAIGIPRPRGEPHGWVWHLVNRKGEVRPLPGKDTGGFISPYMLIGFADNDGVVVARDDSRILAIPIQSP